MSKMDELRALREARYERTLAGAAAKTPGTSARPKKAAPATPAADSTAAEPAEGLCGHRAISGRICTREQGHAAKSHRYS